jgi:NADH-quinone oxidoreductase subunit F
MMKIKSLEDFAGFRRRIMKDKSVKDVLPCLVICAGTGGQASGSNDILRIIKRTILEKNLADRISLRITGCQGFCELDPFILVEPGRHLYPKIRMDDVPRIIESALEGRVIDELVYRDSKSFRCFKDQSEIPFFRKQTRTILGMNQHIDPIRILDYIEHGGYEAVEKVMTDLDPAGIVEEVKRSGLRGRGGAGFPTGRKWELARNAGKPGGAKTIICNADEGDPGAYMDRSLLEGNPHAIIEGMFIAGKAIGAEHGVIYVRTEYPLAIKHALIAIRQARDLGILGKDIFGTGFNFDIDIFRGAGAFVCGEETALIRSIEGRSGEPRQKPPYPIEKGLWGHPTCINNVETLANVPVIICRGADDYARVGVPGNTGTKIFSLVGKIRHTGLVEVPMGTTIREIVYEIGGGSPGKAGVKAVQTGGPSGGCIPAEKFDLRIDYDTLAAAGSIMGSGGMIVMDEDTCMVDVARYYMNFLMEESCGKCFTCRKGTQRMYEILDDITKGRGTLEQLDLLEELALAVKDTTMCGLGQTAPNPVLSTLRYYRHEYLEHILHKRCPAGVCRELTGAPCQAACPLGTEAWRYVALLEKGEYEEAYKVIRAANPLPSVCARVCSHPCEDRCRAGTAGGQPVAIRALKRFVTDSVDPSVFKPVEPQGPVGPSARVAVVGSGPAGLSAGHYLSLMGHRVTIYEKEDEPGGMLVCGIPAYRLPRDVLRKEIEALKNKNLELKCGMSLGRDFTMDDLFSDGFKALFIAVGAHRSRKLGLEGEDCEGVVPAMKFLKAFNLSGRSMARGRVGIIGGGNSAVDAARVALRQEGVESVTILYRRSRGEMPAYEEEIREALDEGVRIETYLSPVRLMVEGGRLTGVECIQNRPGEFDVQGRRRPVPLEGTERVIPLDTLIVAIGEQPETDGMASKGLSVARGGTLDVDPGDFTTGRPGVFAGGDTATGPSTVVDALAAGKKAAVKIDRYLRGLPLGLEPEPALPAHFVEPAATVEGEDAPAERAVQPELPPKERKLCFKEVQAALSEEAARTEARRCLRCDLEFTAPADKDLATGREGSKAS